MNLQKCFIIYLYSKDILAIYISLLNESKSLGHKIWPSKLRTPSKCYKKSKVNGADVVMTAPQISQLKVMYVIRF